MARVICSTTAAAMAMLLAACVATGQTPATSGIPSLLPQGADDAAAPDTGIGSGSGGTTNGAITVNRTASGASASATAGSTGGPANVSVTVSRVPVVVMHDDPDEAPSPAAEQPAQLVDGPMQDDVPAAATPPSPPAADSPPGVHLPSAPYSADLTCPESLAPCSCIIDYVKIVIFCWLPLCT